MTRSILITRDSALILREEIFWKKLTLAESHARFRCTPLSWWTSLEQISSHFWIQELLQQGNILWSAPCIISIAANAYDYANMAAMTVTVAWVSWNRKSTISQTFSGKDVYSNGCFPWFSHHRTFETMTETLPAHLCGRLIVMVMPKGQWDASSGYSGNVTMFRGGLNVNFCV